MILKTRQIGVAADWILIEQLLSLDPPALFFCSLPIYSVCSCPKREMSYA